jgi:hypothetical protein
MNSDGTKAIVGMYGDDTGGTDTGSAYIYTYSGGSWGSEVRIVASDAATNDGFGNSVSMSSDGTKIIVGAKGKGGNNTGAVYIYTYSSGSWSQEAKIQAATNSGGDNFGHIVSMSSDGTKVIVGAPYQDAAATNAGAAYIYTYSGGSWGSEVRIVAPDAQASDLFGQGVAISGDGTKVIVGAHSEAAGGNYAGAAYIFTYSGSSWDTGTKIVAADAQAEDNFGYAVSMNSDGTRVLVGAPYEDHINQAGAAYIFTYSGSSWDTGTKIVAPDAQANDYFGKGVYMSSDGTKVIVGAEGEDVDGLYGDAGAAYIFTYSGSSWDTGTKIVATDAGSSDTFGSGYYGAVAMNTDGTKVIVGAIQETTGGSSAGAVYIYDYRTTEVFDASTQVFTATGTGIVSGSTVQLEGADGSLYSVIDATPNAAGTQVTFKMGSEAAEFPPSAMSTNTSVTGYIASASINSSYAWRAFDDVVSTTQYWYASPGNATEGYDYNSPYLAGLDSAATQDISGTTHRGHWIQLQIPSAVILTRAVIGTTQSGYQHGQFVILGSNDNANWTLLHAGTGTTLSTNVTTLSAGVTTSFTYFRVVIKSKNSGSGNYDIELNNVQFFGGSGSWDLAQQPYKVKVSSTSGLIATSTTAIGFAVGWTTAAGANLRFDINSSTTQTLVGTDGGGGTNRTFSVAPSSTSLPSGLVLDGSTGAITGTIGAVGTTIVTFRLTDNNSGLFTDRAINIVGISALYTWSPNPFTFDAAKLNGGGAPPSTNSSDVLFGGTLADFKNRGTYSSAAWRNNTAYFKLGASGVDSAENGFQLWTVPVTGTYTIKAYGASGGGLENPPGGLYGSGPSRGGFGAWTQGNFNLTKGEKVLIIVGHVGRDGTSYGTTSSGGGGGTYVLKELGASTAVSNASIYCIAGGGGGGRDGNSDHRSPGDGIASQATEITSGGGGSGSANYSSGGGAGYFADGNVPASTTSGFQAVRPYAGSQGGYGAWSWGSSHGYGNRYGGFGGGGGNGAHDPGGGGGYTGGGGSSFGYNYDPVSQGGTSRNNGIAGTISFGNSTETEANGKVIVTLN